MATYYLDAYNVIHCNDSLRATAEKSVESARNTLVKMAADYCTLSGQKVVVVFDGTGNPSMSAKGASRVSNLQIVYCEGAMSADTYIERAIFETKKRLDAVVVTADNTVAQLVRGMGALVLKPQSFLNDVQKSLSETPRRAAVPKKRRFGAGLSDRLDERSQAELHELRAVLSPQNDHPKNRKRTKKRKSR
jgi:predicted RNA-binding protein with PIN domain